MKILYRPQRGGLDEAMAEKKEFASLKDMFEYIVKYWKESLERLPFGVSDLSISYYCYDERIDWETYIVCTNRMYNEKYDHPHAIGFCAFKE